MFVADVTFDERAFAIERDEPDVAIGKVFTSLGDDNNIDEVPVFSKGFLGSLGIAKLVKISGELVDFREA